MIKIKTIDTVMEQDKYILKGCTMGHGSKQ